MRIAFYQSIAPVGISSEVVDIEPMRLSEVGFFANLRASITGARCVVIIGVRHEPVVMLMGSIE